MSTHTRRAVLLGALVGAGVAWADAPKPASNATPAATGELSAEKKAAFRQLRDEREKLIHDRGEIFSRIATKHDYRGEYVLFHDDTVTAFLDIKDPRHPRYAPPKSGHDEDAPAVDAKRVSHILVVPNQPRETIGKSVSSDISADDLEATLAVMREAKTIAGRFGVKNAKIYVKSPARVGVGYLHVHVIGERDPSTPYPPALH